MKLPLSPETAVWLAVPLGMVFGLLLQRGGVTRYDVIVNQFRLRDFRMLKVMLSAVVVGGIGVWLLHGAELAAYHIKPANLLVVVLGAVLFGVGMVLYGYCPGTGVAAVASGSVDALVGLLGMLAGGIAYGLTFPWVRDHLQGVWALGKARLPDLTGVPDGVWFAGLLAVAGLLFWWLESRERQGRSS